MSKVEGAVADLAVASGLVSEVDLLRLRKDLGDSSDDPKVLEWLLKHGLLTKWQAAQLRAGRTQNLVLGHYKLLSPLGAGGMGTVFRALDARLGREVAVKVLPPSAATPEAVGRFRREALAALELRHDHVVASFELAQHGSIHFLVMELVDGPSLAAHLANKKRLSVQETARIGYEVALALEHARRQGIVHRDIKPSNILLSREGKVKVADLGLAKFFGPQARVRGPETRTGQFMGTIDYCAPEQCQDAKRADVRSDIYSLGCTLYHCLTGKPPFPDGTEVERIMAHIELLPGRIGLKNLDVPPMLAELIEKRMLSKQPAERFQTPAEVAEALAPWAKGQYTAASNPWAELSGMASLLDEAAPMLSPQKPAAQQQRETRPGQRRPAATLKARPAPGRPGPKSSSVLAGPLSWAAVVLAILVAITAASLLWPRSKPEPVVAGASETQSTPRGDGGSRVALDNGMNDIRNGTADVDPVNSGETTPENGGSNGPIVPRPDDRLPNTLADEEKSEGWQLLFDGKTLDGWQAIGKVGSGYEVRDGNLVCPRDGGGKLFTTREYANFILRFDYRLEPGGNNGVALRAPLEGDPAFTGMESQILDDDDPQYANLEAGQYHGSIYKVIPARRGAPKKAGEWNTEEIVCDGRQVVVTVNGQTIVDSNLGDVKDPAVLQEHPGLQRPRGYVGFLGHGPALVEFRNIRIKELPDSSQPSPAPPPGLVLTIKHGAPVQAVAVSADGATFMTAGPNKIAQLWNAADGTPRGSPLTHEGEIFNVGLSSDATYAAEQILHRRLFGNLWALAAGATGKSTQTIPYGRMDFSTDGSGLAALGLEQGSIFIRKYQLDKLTWRDVPLRPIHVGLTASAFSPDLRLLAMAEDIARGQQPRMNVAHEIVFYETDRGRPKGQRVRYQVDGNVVRPAFSVPMAVRWRSPTPAGNCGWSKFRMADCCSNLR